MTDRIAELQWLSSGEGTCVLKRETLAALLAIVRAADRLRDAIDGQSLWSAQIAYDAARRALDDK
jgi:transposase